MIHPDGQRLNEIEPGIFITPTRAAAEALFRDITNGWVITTQNGIIDCIEEHIRAFSSSTLSDLAIERQRSHHAEQRANIAEAEEQRIKDSFRAVNVPLEEMMKDKKRAKAAEADRDRLLADCDALRAVANERMHECDRLRDRLMKATGERDRLREENAELRSLVDGATDVVELWGHTTVHNGQREWAKDWLERAIIRVKGGES